MTGTAIAVESGGSRLVLSRGGTRRVVRRIELDAVFGAVADLDGDRFASAVASERGARLALRSGLEIDVPWERLWPSGPARAELVVDGVRLMTCDGAGEGEKRLGLQADAAVVIGGGAVVWMGPSSELPSCGFELRGVPRIVGRGRLLSPGLVDCHAHPIFAGDRAAEFAQRAAGATYQEIAAAGGGIAATLVPTRAATAAELAELAAGRLRRAFAAGTTTMECKSGYDLRVDGELRLLEVARELDGLLAIDTSPTLLGAHLVPSEYRDDRDGYVAAVVDRMIPRAAAAALTTTVDVYCDEGAFTLAETERILRAGLAHGLLARAHVGQFADLGAPQLLAEIGGLSADHLEEVSADGMRAMAAAGVVAVMLPGACVQLRQTPPPVEALRAAGVELALASDLNPGTIHCEVLHVPMWLATTHYGMTVAEAWLGVTRYAARALGRHDIGVLQVSGAADLVLWDTDEPAAVPYSCGRNLVAGVVKGGVAHGFDVGDLSRS